MGGFRSADVQQLLHNKFVVILGDSIQRSVYKDLVKFLQTDSFLTFNQLKHRGEFIFENDVLIEGGQHEEMHNGTTYREVRQYRSGHHLVRFYFLTRVYSTYLESILSDFQSGPQPDVLMINSCVWDVNRYGDHHLEAYKTTLDLLFLRLKEVLTPHCLILWTTTMPVGYKDDEIPMFQTPPQNVRMDMVMGNFYSSTLADFHKVDVLDMHYHFRHDLRHRWVDAIHWNFLAHRKYTQILLSRIAMAWDVEPPKDNLPEGSVHLVAPHPVAPCPELRPPRPEQELYTQGAVYMPGYTSFDGSDISAVSAVSPFASDSLILSADLIPGYFSPPRGSWKMRRPRSLKPRAGWRHPYR
ncbi:PC-esterase domain-containing protein 1A-like isoform 2-T3 [Anomaloglossus baeobatrachus]|uniref:PC-esterase domain-containing protein 1A-like isoform X2 n=1 Tax=Anomaloglossus baeobatrachus TaxID=238106 RepID=UPI003F50CE72